MPIDAIDQAMRRNYEVAQAAAAVTREITLAIIGTAIAVIGVLQFTDTKVHEKPSPTLIGLAKLFITSPIVTIAVIGSCIWATRMLFGVTDYRKYRIIRWLNRVLQPFDLRITITIFLLFGIMMAFGQYLILF